MVKQEYISKSGAGNPLLIDPDTIKDYTLESYGLTPELLKSYMYGVPIKDPTTGEEMGDDFYKHYLEVALAKAEQNLDIAILPRWVHKEQHNMYDSDFKSNMFTHLYKRPILFVDNLGLQFGGKPIFNYPSDWWRVYSKAGHIMVQPTALMQSSMGGLGFGDGEYGAPMYAGIPVASTSTTFAPQLITVDYIAGLLPRKHAGYAQDWEMPASLEQLIAKYALVELFQQWGRLIIGAGIASRSLSVDGISESIVTTQSAMFTGAGADIVLVKEDIQELEENLKSVYGIATGII